MAGKRCSTSAGFMAAWLKKPRLENKTSTPTNISPSTTRSTLTTTTITSSQSSELDTTDIATLETTITSDTVITTTPATHETTELPLDTTSLSAKTVLDTTTRTMTNTNTTTSSTTTTKKKRTRNYCDSWRARFSWIEHNKERNHIVCSVCQRGHKHVRTRLQKLTHAEEIFVSIGFSTYKKALTAFAKHENSDLHVLCTNYEFARARDVNVTKQINVQHEKQRQDNLVCLTAIVDSLKFLARQGLAIRGSTHDESNAMQLLKLRSQDVEQLSSWISAKTNWTHWAAQNEFLELIAKDILRGVLNDIKDNHVYAVMADETSDQSRKEQLVVLVRHVDKNLQIQEDLLGLHCMETCDALSITNAIKDILLRCDLDIHKCRGQAYDGASTMMGNKSGVGTRIKEVESRAIVVHCQAHSLNLAVQDATGNVNELNNFMNLVNDLVNFLRSSPKRLAELAKFAQAAAIDCSIRPLCPTRWTLRFQSLESLKKLATVILEELENICERERDRDARAKATGYIKFMTTFEFCILLEISLELFCVTDKLSKVLQKETISAMDGKKAAELVLATIHSWRNDAHFCELWTAAESLRETLGADVPTTATRRPRNRPKRYEIGDASAHEFTSPEDAYITLYYRVLDETHGAISRRISGKGFEILTNVESIIINGFRGDAIDREDIATLQAHYKDDINMDHVVRELCVISNKTAAKSVTKISECLAVIRNMSDGEKEMLPGLIKMLQLYLVLPCSTASAERSFSSMRRVKSYLRSTMSQQRLNHLMIIHEYKERVDNITTTKIVREFILANEKRQRTFALPSL